MVSLGNSWDELLAAEFASDYYLQLREFLKKEREGQPFVCIFSSAVHLIRTLPALSFDEKRIEDVALHPHELTHAPDAFRYGLMSLPFLPSGKVCDMPRPRGRQDDYLRFFAE